VKIIADYELAGLVVSHNDPFKWYRFDLSHDEFSLDTRDICVIWGRNIKNADYSRVSFWNDDWTCNWRYGRDVRGVENNALSNNHLITNSDAIRQTIAGITVGDQIRLKGHLVSYANPRLGNRWRNSSMSREDEGDGACEVVFVKELQILSSPNHGWAVISRLAFWGMIGLILVRIGGLFFRTKSNV
jgi:hypothetical protein